MFRAVLADGRFTMVTALQPDRLRPGDGIVCNGMLYEFVSYNAPWIYARRQGEVKALRLGLCFAVAQGGRGRSQTSDSGQTTVPLTEKEK